MDFSKSLHKIHWGNNLKVGDKHLKLHFSCLNHRAITTDCLFNRELNLEEKKPSSCIDCSHEKKTLQVKEPFLYVDRWTVLFFPVPTLNRIFKSPDHEVKYKILIFRTFKPSMCLLHRERSEQKKKTETKSLNPLLLQTCLPASWSVGPSHWGSHSLGHVLSWKSWWSWANRHPSRLLRSRTPGGSRRAALWGRYPQHSDSTIKRFVLLPYLNGEFLLKQGLRK